MKRPLQLILRVALVAALVHGAALAQARDASQRTSEEIEAAFENQLTRGLRITTGESDATATEAAPQDYVQVDEADLVFVRLLFDFDSAALRPNQKPLLANVCQAMRSADVQLFRVVGHTDAVGPDEYNRHLSVLRAEEVRRHLVEECGIPAERLEAVGVGKDHLLDAADPDSEQNRRVEFQAVS